MDTNSFTYLCSAFFNPNLCPVHTVLHALFGLLQGWQGPLAESPMQRGRHRAPGDCPSAVPHVNQPETRVIHGGLCACRRPRSVRHASRKVLVRRWRAFMSCAIQHITRSDNVVYYALSGRAMLLRLQPASNKMTLIQAPYSVFSDIGLSLKGKQPRRYRIPGSGP